MRRNPLAIFLCTFILALFLKCIPSHGMFHMVIAAMSIVLALVAWINAWKYWNIVFGDESFAGHWLFSVICVLSSSWLLGTLLFVFFAHHVGFVP